MGVVVQPPQSVTTSRSTSRSTPATWAAPRRAWRSRSASSTTCHARRADRRGGRGGHRQIRPTAPSARSVAPARRRRPSVTPASTLPRAHRRLRGRVERAGDVDVVPVDTARRRPGRAGRPRRQRARPARLGASAGEGADPRTDPPRRRIVGRQPRLGAAAGCRNGVGRGPRRAFGRRTSPSGPGGAPRSGRGAALPSATMSPESSLDAAWHRPAAVQVRRGAATTRRRSAPTSTRWPRWWPGSRRSGSRPRPGRGGRGAGAQRRAARPAPPRRDGGRGDGPGARLGPCGGQRHPHQGAGGRRAAWSARARTRPGHRRARGRGRGRASLAETAALHELAEGELGRRGPRPRPGGRDHRRGRGRAAGDRGLPMRREAQADELAGRGPGAGRSALERSEVAAPTASRSSPRPGARPGTWWPRPSVCGKVLGDLARRRRAAREQVERLNAARERLLAAYAVVRRTADEATAELKVALPAARVAADQAARRVHERARALGRGHRGGDVHRPHGRAGRRRHRRGHRGRRRRPGRAARRQRRRPTSTCPTPCPGSTDDRRTPGCRPTAAVRGRLPRSSADAEPPPGPRPMPEEPAEAPAGEPLVPRLVPDLADPAPTAEAADEGLLGCRSAPGGAPRPSRSPARPRGRRRHRGPPRERCRPARPSPRRRASPRRPGRTDSGRGGGSRRRGRTAGARGARRRRTGTGGAEACRRRRPCRSRAASTTAAERPRPAADRSGRRRRTQRRRHTAADVYAETEAGDGPVAEQASAGRPVGTAGAAADPATPAAARRTAGRDRPAPAPSRSPRPPPPSRWAARRPLPSPCGAQTTPPRWHEVAAPAPAAGRSSPGPRERRRHPRRPAAAYGDARAAGHRPGSAEADAAGARRRRRGRTSTARRSPRPTAVDRRRAAATISMPTGRRRRRRRRGPTSPTCIPRGHAAPAGRQPRGRRARCCPAGSSGSWPTSRTRCSTCCAAAQPASVDECCPAATTTPPATPTPPAAALEHRRRARGAGIGRGRAPAGSLRRPLAGELGRTVVEPLRERIARSFDDVERRPRGRHRPAPGAVPRVEGPAHRRRRPALRRGRLRPGRLRGVPDGTPVRWLVDRSGDACPDADDNALAGAVCKGEAFPTGDRCPPAHPGCRCLVVPVDAPRC